MSIQTTATPYNAATQRSLGGYAKGQLVLVDGVVWQSLVAANMRYPGSDLAYWQLVA
jgi:hypothetical protein